MNKMRYIKTNESYQSELYEAKKLVRRKYSDKIDECLLYITDNHQVIDSAWSTDEYYIVSINIKGYVPEELKEQIKSSIEKLEFNDMKFMDDYVIYTTQPPRVDNINVNTRELYENIDSNKLTKIIFQIRNVK